MPRYLGAFAMRRAHRLNGPIVAMLLNAAHDRHEGRVFVFQVGAGDGQGNPDLLERFRNDGWSGLLVEPHPDRFHALEALHADSERVAVLNLGLSDSAATLPLYSLTPDAALRHPKVPSSRASLLRDRIAVPGLSPDDITSVDIPLLQTDVVLRELGIDTAAVVVINAGGHEVPILRGVDLSALNPTVVLVASRPGTVQDDSVLASLADAGLTPYRAGPWLAGIVPGLTVPLDDILTFFNRGIGQTEVEE